MAQKKKIDVNKEYNKWCKEIARAMNEKELMSHFRRHVYKHFLKHKDEGKIGRKVWLVAILNFMNFFKQKYKVDKGDMLFECCIYLKEHKKGPVPSFDVDQFLKQHKSEVRDYYYRPWRRKKWQPAKVNK